METGAVILRKGERRGKNPLPYPIVLIILREKGGKKSRVFVGGEEKEISLHSNMSI